MTAPSFSVSRNRATLKTSVVSEQIRQGRKMSAGFSLAKLARSAMAVDGISCSPVQFIINSSFCAKKLPSFSNSFTAFTPNGVEAPAPSRLHVMFIAAASQAAALFVLNILKHSG